ncbi:Cell division protein FtsW [hydrothermal vent metagenome]|uniref:peptidoglycan glycosyltransferase n=1 Tax=hydrothermal vent metagenome TaxID=652676 RepID=A0A3B0YZD1_9ZZZZ
MIKQLRDVFTSDPWLLGSLVSVLSIGLVMLASASMNIGYEQYGSPYFFLNRQVGYLFLGLLIGCLVLLIPLKLWDRSANILLVFSIILLVLVFVPDLGRTVNGSARWIDLGIFNLQPSELSKLAIVVYMAALLAAKGDELLTSWKMLLMRLLPLFLMGVLLLLEPDFGATAVIFGTILAVLFLAGLKLRYFITCFLVLGSGAYYLVVTSPYRFSRLKSYLQACEPEYYFKEGYQLCQALIAFGRGDWFGVGLGSSVQKLFYLPEAHTDFLLAVLGEELGFVGSLIIILLFTLLVLRAFAIGAGAQKAKQYFSAYLAYGIGVWVALQAFINLGVNMGLLPTKGITLPLMSYGGSSIVIMCISFALLLRIAYEQKTLKVKPKSRSAAWAVAS